MEDQKSRPGALYAPKYGVVLVLDDDGWYVEDPDAVVATPLDVDSQGRVVEADGVTSTVEEFRKLPVDSRIDTIPLQRLTPPQVRTMRRQETGGEEWAVVVAVEVEGLGVRQAA